jgi:hypothetical protein
MHTKRGEYVEQYKINKQRAKPQFVSCALMLKFCGTPCNAQSLVCLKSEKRKNKIQTERVIGAK